MAVDWARARRWWIAGGIVLAVGLLLTVVGGLDRQADMWIPGIVLIIVGAAVVARPLGFDE